MRNRLACFASTAAILLAAGSAAAQRIEGTAFGTDGDTMIFNLTINNKTQRLEEVWSHHGPEMVGNLKWGDKQFLAVITKSPLALRQGMCFANAQACTFSPPLEFVSFPMEKGKQWAQTVTVTGETFVAEIAIERKVEKFEKVKVPAGEFEAFRLSFSGRIKSTDPTGKTFTGKEDGTEWFAFPEGKLVPVKIVYRNTFGERFTRELVATSFK
jgi:hypothetical protein